MSESDESNWSILLPMYQSHRRAWIGYCERKLPSGYRDLAEDIVQDALLSLYFNTNLTDIPEDRLLSYVYSAIRHKAIDLIRRETSHESFSLEEKRSVYSGSLLDVLETYLEKEKAVDVVAHIKALGPLYEPVLLLKFHFGLSDREIARKLHLKAVTVTVRIYRGKHKLKILWFCPRY